MPRFKHTTVIASILFIFLRSYDIVQGYVVPLQQQRHVKSKIPMSLNMKAEKNARRFASSLIIGSILSANTLYADPALAFKTYSEGTYNTFEPTSSICISETITTMDFSLPSSYDKISDATASATSELTVETNVLTNTSRKKASTPTKSKGDSSFSFGGGGSNSLSDEEKAQIAATRKAERDALAAEKAAEKAAIAAEKAAERELLAAQKAAEREALAQQKAAENEVRLAEQAQKRALAATAKALAEEKKEAKATSEKFRGAEFVDFSLPSYEDSSSSDGRRDSVFAL